MTKSRVFIVQDPVNKSVDPVSNDIVFRRRFSLDKLSEFGPELFIFNLRQPFSRECSQIALDFLRQHAYDPRVDLFLPTGHQFLVCSAVSAVAEVAADHGLPFQVLVYSTRHNKYDVFTAGDFYDEK